MLRVGDLLRRGARYRCGNRTGGHALDLVVKFTVFGGFFRFRRLEVGEFDAFLRFCGRRVCSYVDSRRRFQISVI